MKTLLALCSMSLLASFAAATNIADDFSDNTLNTSIWSTITRASGSSVSLNNGYLSLSSRGTVITKSSFSSADIVGKFRFTGSGSDRFVVWTRTSGNSTNPYSDLDDGIVFRFQQDTGTVGIDAWNYSIGNTPLAETSATLPNDEWLDFRVTDDGINVELYLNNLDTPILTATSTLSTGEKIAMNNALFDVTTQIDFISVESISNPSKDGDFVTEFREFMDGTDPESGASYNPLSQHLVYHFSGDKNTPEHSGYYYPLENINGDYTEDRFGNYFSAYTVNNDQQYIEGEAPDLRNTSFSISMWVKKLYQSGQGGWSFGIGSDSANGKIIHIAYDYGGTIRFSFFYNDLDASSQLEPHSWHHVVCTYNNANRQRKIFLNGTEIASDISGNTFTGNTYIRIGNENLEIDDFRIYDKVLGQTEVLELLNISNPDSDGDKLTDSFERLYSGEGINMISWLDGLTDYRFSQNNFRYYHIQAGAPGIPGSLGLATIINSDFWLPDWPGEGDQIDLNDSSSTYSYPNPVSIISQNSYTIYSYGRSSISETQPPSGQNGNVLVMRGNDIGIPGAAWHQIYILPSGNLPLNHLSIDSDGDNIADGQEILNGTSPTAPNSSEEDTYSITILNLANGSISLEPAHAEYTEGSSIKVLAEPNPNFTFSSWTGDIQGSQNPYTFNIDKNLTIGAIFEPIQSAGLPEITQQPTSQTISSRESATLSVEANGDNLSYQWYWGVAGDKSNPIENGSNSSITLSGLSNTAFVWVLVSSTEGEVESIVARITVNQNFEGFFLFDNASVAGPNVYWNSWLGFYYMDNREWIYHLSYGWIYANVSGNSSESAWLYSVSAGSWLWTSNILTEGVAFHANSGSFAFWDDGTQQWWPF